MTQAGYYSCNTRQCRLVSCYHSGSGHDSAIGLRLSGLQTQLYRRMPCLPSQMSSEAETQKREECPGTESGKQAVGSGGPTYSAAACAEMCTAAFRKRWIKKLIDIGACRLRRKMPRTGFCSAVALIRSKRKPRTTPG